MKHIHRPGDVVACACEGCSNEFTVKPHGTHARYCSKRCRDMAARIEAGRKPEPAPSWSDALGGVKPGGELVCGTVSLGRRREYDVRDLPADEGRLWT